MKLSKYNYVYSDDEGTIVLNTHSGSMLGLNGEYTAQYRRLQQGERAEDLRLLSDELTKGGMLVDESCDEDRLLKLESTLARFASKDLLLTIAPTFGCNFRCPYCYEKGRKNTTMTDEVAKQLVTFIKDGFAGLKCITVGWYGGEPLLCMNRICSLTDQIKEAIGPACDYSASIVTNGYLLTRNVAEELIDAGVRQAQITIDGSKADHDARRILHDGSPTYERIFQNIKSCADILQIVVRINVDKSNVRKATEILSVLEKLGLKHSVSFVLAPVEDINQTCRRDIHCMSMMEFSQEELDFYYQAVQNGFKIQQHLGCNPAICGAVSLNAYVIDPLGDLYKCWDEIGDVDKRIGNVSEGVPTIMNKNITRWLGYEPNDSECLSCPVYPMCLGGCPHYAMEGHAKRYVSARFNVDQRLVLARQMNRMTRGHADV